MARLTVLPIALILLLCSPSRQTNAAPPAPASPADREAEYTRSIERRADGIVAPLELNDPAKAARVRNAVVDQYRALRDWHDGNGPALKELKKQQQFAAPDPQRQAKADEINVSLKSLHDAFLAKLATDLTPAQVEQVKDGMTYHVVRVTYAGFCDMLPALTDAQKAKVLQTLQEAREEAMDAGSAGEKHAVFGRYKGRINNYLASEGYDLKQASKDWAERRRNAKANANANLANEK